jgi:hypothetical protein
MLYVYHNAIYARTPIKFVLILCNTINPNTLLLPVIYVTCGGHPYLISYC